MEDFIFAIKYISGVYLLLAFIVFCCCAKELVKDLFSKGGV